MEYFNQTLWLITWPLLIVFSYHATVWALKFFDKNINTVSEQTETKKS